MTTRTLPATVAWTATEAEAYCEPPFPDDAFCIELIVLNGDRHIYRLNRKLFAQLFTRISGALTGQVSLAAE